MKDGGSAFPNRIPVEGHQGVTKPGILIQRGMTLRQWYAGMAISGICSAHGNMRNWEKINIEKIMAGEAFKLADAMIAFEESEKKGV